jgi:hypothetical protein
MERHRLGGPFAAGAADFDQYQSPECRLFRTRRLHRGWIVDPAGSFGRPPRHDPRGILERYRLGRPGNSRPARGGSPNGTNNSPFQAVSCGESTGCTAVGNYDSGNAKGDFLPLSEHRDSNGWSVQAMPAPLGTFYNDLRGVSCPSPHTCMAVGMSYRYNVANNSPGPHIGLAQLYKRA